jgi:subtilisin-like proprotein convertase family protein
MDARNTMQGIVAVLVVAGASFPVLANPIYTYGGDFNLPILDPPGPGSLMTLVTVDVPDLFIISDLDVRINITHTKVFDLQLFVQSPDGIRICLNMYDFTEFFEGADYKQTIFDDEAEVPIEEGEPPFSGRFRPKAVDPHNLLEVFTGMNACGSWQLQIYDMWPVDSGTLDSAELIITTPEPATAMFLTLGAGFVILYKSRRVG